jgi:hypothetical protein
VVLRSSWYPSRAQVMHDVVTHFCRCWRSFFFQCEALLTLGALFVNIAVGQRLHLHVIRCDASHGPNHNCHLPLLGTGCDAEARTNSRSEHAESIVG